MIILAEDEELTEEGEFRRIESTTSTTEESEGEGEEELTIWNFHNVLLKNLPNLGL